MHSMFRSYDNNVIDIPPCCSPESQLGAKFGFLPKKLYNIKEEFIGIQVEYKKPFTLYFNLKEEQGKDLTDLMKSSSVLIELYSLNHKLVLEKVFQGNKIFNAFTNDLEIYFSQEESSTLKQETYGIQVTCITDSTSYIVFSEHDAKLIIR